MSDKRRKLRIPHVIALLTIVVFAASLLTYVVPSGRYERKEENVAGMTKEVVIPGTFQTLKKVYSLRGVLLGSSNDNANEAYPVSFMGALTAIPKGLEESADIIFFIFIIGGTFGILQATGTIPAAVKKLLDHLGHSTTLLTIVIMVVIGIGGSTLGMGEEFIPLVPIFIMISRRLGYDRIFGLALVLLAADMGFAAATTNPFTVNIAQGIAGIKLNSGISLRIIFFIGCMTLTIVHVLRYGARIKASPSASLLADVPDEHVNDTLDSHAFSRSHMLTIVLSILIFAGILFGVQRWGWWLSDMAGGFFLMGIVAAIVCRMTLHEATGAFVKGMEEMVVAALVVGFAKGVQVALSDGQILHTIIHYAETSLQGIPRQVSVLGMLVFQTTLNFAIPSGSGQAAVTMPIMAPLADLLGITRQTAVLAFQFGDGLSNTIVPTSGILMAMLALAGIPYNKWLRFVWPLFLQLLALAGVFLVIAVAIGYS
ncbi:MAG: YfcC family protein [Planctomycetota bacterium]|jgi:uncharacterized ion transporter superfamily protein YfcC